MTNFESGAGTAQAGLGAASERETTKPLDDAERAVRELKAYCVRDDDACRPAATAVRSANGWQRKARELLKGESAPTKQVTPGQLLGHAKQGAALPFTNPATVEALETKAAKGRALDREAARGRHHARCLQDAAARVPRTSPGGTVSEFGETLRRTFRIGYVISADRGSRSHICCSSSRRPAGEATLLIDSATPPALEALRDLKQRCRKLVGVRLEARRDLDARLEAAQSWSDDARGVLDDPHARGAPRLASELLEQLAEIRCDVGPVAEKLRESVEAAERWVADALLAVETDDAGALTAVVDQATTAPAPRRALAAVKRRHALWKWTREARGALVACGAREDRGDHDVVARPTLQDARGHLDALF